MKHFTITTEEQAEALRPFNVTPDNPLTVGHIIMPDADTVYITNWVLYPEAYAITFKQCMSIVRDEVTEDVLRELGRGETFQTDSNFGFDIEKGRDVSIVMTKGGNVFVTVFIANDIDHAIVPIPNPTATKLRLLTSILRGQ